MKEILLMEDAMEYLGVIAFQVTAAGGGKPEYVESVRRAGKMLSQAADDAEKMWHELIFRQGVSWLLEQEGM